MGAGRVPESDPRPTNKAGKFPPGRKEEMTIILLIIISAMIV
jgi:hypothetical protein